ncbi:hypothetical protein CEUSTIGMA_g957.t1 [Chlamydomonas eustigma]|uniref:Uncharacterized protein n=1 Tax=Chlamydomonas eustigma TaxID=1157962 RepID=A0A250WRN7_9CHLO|nr:hypothetical protein CEUSTIGMA_g957.t1 [Chlamydomonas eustigma]|eukprot:GAX73505.1 hypothetical protein CEUSTIGMA_g957.t1 [Chlamydomonas eustigma]
MHNLKDAEGRLSDSSPAPHNLSAALNISIDNNGLMLIATPPAQDINTSNTDGNIGQPEYSSNFELSAVSSPQPSTTIVYSMPSVRRDYAGAQGYCARHSSSNSTSALAGSEGGAQQLCITARTPCWISNDTITNTTSIPETQIFTPTQMTLLSLGQSCLALLPADAPINSSLILARLGILSNGGNLSQALPFSISNDTSLSSPNLTSGSILLLLSTCSLPLRFVCMQINTLGESSSPPPIVRDQNGSDNITSSIIADPATSAQPAPTNSSPQTSTVSINTALEPPPMSPSSPITPFPAVQQPPPISSSPIPLPTLNASFSTPNLFNGTFTSSPSLSHQNSTSSNISDPSNAIPSAVTNNPPAVILSATPPTPQSSTAVVEPVLPTTLDLTSIPPPFPSMLELSNIPPLHGQQGPGQQGFLPQGNSPPNATNTASTASTASTADSINPLGGQALGILAPPDMTNGSSPQLLLPPVGNQASRGIDSAGQAPDSLTAVHGNDTAAHVGSEEHVGVLAIVLACVVPSVTVCGVAGLLWHVRQSKLINVAIHEVLRLKDDDIVVRTSSKASSQHSQRTSIHVPLTF